MLSSAVSDISKQPAQLNQYKSCTQLYIRTAYKIKTLDHFVKNLHLVIYCMQDEKIGQFLRNNTFFYLNIKSGMLRSCSGVVCDGLFYLDDIKLYFLMQCVDADLDV